MLLIWQVFKLNGRGSRCRRLFHLAGFLFGPPPQFLATHMLTIRRMNPPQEHGSDWNPTLCRLMQSMVVLLGVVLGFQRLLDWIGHLHPGFGKAFTSRFKLLFFKQPPFGSLRETNRVQLLQFVQPALFQLGLRRFMVPRLKLLGMRHACFAWDFGIPNPKFDTHTHTQTHIPTPTVHGRNAAPPENYAFLRHSIRSFITSFLRSFTRSCIRSFIRRS